MANICTTALNKGMLLKKFVRLSSTARDLSSIKPPVFVNEPILTFAPGSEERNKLTEELNKTKKRLSSGDGAYHVPLVINGEEIYTDETTNHYVPFDNKTLMSKMSIAGEKHLKNAIESNLEAWKSWSRVPFTDRVGVFLKAATLLSTKYRYEMMAATMVGQGKTIHQAEIDCISELVDFWRYYVECAYVLDSFQPLFNPPGAWNRSEIRPLEGFVYGISPFNFTAIGGGICSSPAIMGNVVIWKPSTYAVYSNYLIYKILKEAGLPDGVINFIGGSASEITNHLLKHPSLTGVHFTGSTDVFDSIWKTLGSNISNYKSYPRIVGETGGKNMHFIHESADLKNAVSQTIRAAFEYSGQKCSAASRVYVPDSIWPQFKEAIIESAKNVKVGSVYDYTNFTSSVISKRSYDKIVSYLKNVGTSADPNTKVLVGGEYSDSEGYYISPTVLHTTDINSPTITNELFGPVLTVYVYKASEYEKYLEIAEKTSVYSLTASIFANDLKAIQTASKILKYACGNFYINDKCTGALVAQQPFGGSRKSGTNEKAGSIFNLIRWCLPQSIKVNLNHMSDTWTYPSNLP